MDIITQGLLGATLAQSAAQKSHVKMATFIGFFAGLLADLDIVIRSSSDPLLNLEFHRHFTHSLFFIPLGGLVAAALLWPFFRHKLAFRHLYLYAFMGYSLSGILDACTSYGTYLLWPLSNERFAWNMISIIDPVFSGCLILALVFSFRKQHKMVARAGLLLAAIYMSIGGLQLQRAETQIYQLAEQRGHQAARLEVKPTLANLLLWRSIYEYEGKLYVDAVRVGLFSTPRVFTGASVALFKLDEHSASIPVDSVLYNDIQRFSRFSDGYLAFTPEHPDTLSDIRYSNLPTSLEPLWGINFNPADVEQHVTFSFYRDMSRTNREAFMAMLFNTHDQLVDNDTNNSAN
ncbi:MAG: metal-dependent hydrolase [Gammaproteobacteria bacterium]|nr:metal-dependent hydrolase [Gammaproteobacteria bacterium]